MPRRRRFITSRMVWDGFALIGKSAMWLPEMRLRSCQGRGTSSGTWVPRFCDCSAAAPRVTSMKTR